MIYTDGTYIISSVSIDDLEDFAMCVGLSSRNYRDSEYPHYIIPTPALRRRAMFIGAKLVSSTELIRIVKSK